jgi:Protein of unknown function (DUF2867)
MREVVLDSSAASTLSVYLAQIEKVQEQCDEGGPMPQISIQEFGRLPLRVHDFLAGVPLHDVWAVDLPRLRSGITLDEFLRTARACPCAPAPCPCTHPSLVRVLLNIRLFVGRRLGWDREPAANAWETFATRITTADRSRSLAPAGTREGLFRVVYRFENEQLLELINRTAHAAALSALVETANGYRFYFGLYVRNIGRFTPIYMALIDPFRKLMVYPSLLRAVRAKWNKTFGST